MNNTIYTPLKNKMWLFTETGKAGFHYDDVSNAVTGLKKEVKESHTHLSEKKLVDLVEKWFPDIIEREQIFWMEQPRAPKKTISMHQEGQSEIIEYSQKYAFKEE
jgi:hypothetical protein